MNKKELIEDYIMNVYQISSNIDGWCIKNKTYNKQMSFSRVASDVKRVFPNNDIRLILFKWENNNIKAIEDRLYNFMSNYKLMLGDDISEAWGAVDKLNNTFTLDKLLVLFPKHQHYGVHKFIERWFEEKLLEANEKLFGIKS